MQTPYLNWNNITNEKELVNALWVRQICFPSSQIQANSQAQQVQQGLMTECVPCMLVPSEWPPLPGRVSTAGAGVMPSQLCHAHQALAWLEGLLLPAERASYREQALWKRFFWWNHAAQEGDFYRERGLWKCSWWLRSVILVENQLMWVMLIIASSLHPTVSLVSIHHPLPPSCQGISGYNGESCFWSYYLCKSNMPYDGGEVWLAFPEGVQSTAEGSGQMCVILSAESS